MRAGSKRSWHGCSAVAWADRPSEAMKMTAEEISEAIASGRIRALSLDTSTIDRKSRRLESGLLLQLGQFRDAESTLVLSDIVEQESIAHLTKDATDARAELGKGLKSVCGSWMVPEARTMEIQQELIGAIEPVEIALRRWQAFSERCGLQIASTSEFCAAGDLKQRYFDVKPPFEDRADKKKEFPDAMALLSLEGWARKNGTVILTVTSDKGWIAFCDESKYLVAVEDLGGALANFHRHDPGHLLPNIARAIAEGGDDFGIRKAIIEAVSEAADVITFDVDANSDMDFEEDQVEVEIIGVRIRLEDPDHDIEAVARDEDYLVIRFIVDVTADVVGHFSFSKWDSVDREDIPFGSGSEVSEEEFPVEVLVTLAGNTHSGIKINRVEVLPYKGYAYLGQIEPDWMNDPDNFD